MRVYKKRNSWFSKLLACVEVPLAGLVVMKEPYVIGEFRNSEFLFAILIH